MHYLYFQNCKRVTTALRVNGSYLLPVAVAENVLAPSKSNILYYYYYYHMSLRENSE